MTHVRTI